MAFDIGILLAVVSATAPAFISMFSLIDRLDSLIDECRTLREILARQISSAEYCSPNDILEAWDSASCEDLEYARGSVRNATLGALILVAYLLMVGVAADSFIVVFFAATVPYIVLFSFARISTAGVLARARALASTGVCNPKRDREEREANKQ